MSPSSTLDKARALLEDRLAELDAERKQLERAIAELPAGRRGSARPRGATSAAAGSATGATAGNYRAKRRRRGGTRAEQALRHITEAPGITAGEIAIKMNIAPNYMYRVMNDLKRAGAVRKDGKGYHPI